MFCPKCGKQINDKSRFCMACGCEIAEYGTENGAFIEQSDNNTSIEAKKEIDVSKEAMHRVDEERRRREAAAQHQIEKYKRDESIGKIMKRKQRRALLPVWILLIVITLVGSGFYAYKNGYTVEDIKNKVLLIVDKNGPVAKVAQYCEAMKNYDIDTMDTLVQRDSSFLLDDYDSENYIAVFYDYIKELGKDIQYKILQTNVDGNRASVEVSFRYKDISELMSAVFSEYLDSVIDEIMQKGELSDEAMEDLLIQTFTDKRDTIAAKETEKTIKFELIKHDDVWIINRVPFEIEDVITANISNIVSQELDELSGKLAALNKKVILERDYAIGDDSFYMEVSSKTGEKPEIHISCIISDKANAFSVFSYLNQIIKSDDAAIRKIGEVLSYSILIKEDDTILVQTIDSFSLMSNGEFMNSTDYFDVEWLKEQEISKEYSEQFMDYFTSFLSEMN